MSSAAVEKTTINLLQAELLPKQDLLTLKRVALSWGALIVVLVLAILITKYQINQSNQKLGQLRVEQSQQNKQINDLEQKLKLNVPKPSLTAKLAKTKLLLANKKALYSELTNVNSTYVVGFAKAMTDLSEMHSRDISLQEVSITHDEMSFTGIARTPESVPAWLAQFESSTVLSGKVFNYFSLEEHEESDFINFVVSTTRAKVKN